MNIAYTKLGPPRFTPNLFGAPQVSINLSTVWESMFHADPLGNPQPRLIKEWDISPDGFVWTMKLQEGVQFHRGLGEMTAEDLVWSIDNRLEEGAISRPDNMFETFKCEGGGMTVIDRFTVAVDTANCGVRFDLTRNTTTGRQGGQPIASKKHFEDLGRERSQVEEPVGTGPWVSVEYKSSEIWRLEAVPDHWRKTPNFAQLNILEIPEESTRVANFLAGELDSMHLALESFPRIESMDGVKLKRLAADGQMVINLPGQLYVDREDLPAPRDVSQPWISEDADTSSAAWEQARLVRQAMAIAIDRQLMVDTLIRGEGSPTSLFTGMVHEQRLGALESELVYEYNPDRAKQLLAEAGYGDGFEIDMALTARSWPVVAQQGETVCVMWEEIGIRCGPERSQMSAFRPQFIEGDFAGANIHGIDHPFLEEKMAEAAETFNEGKRLEIEAEIARWIFDNAVILPTFKVNRVYPLGPNIDDWEMACCRARVLLDLEHIPHRR